MRRLASAIGAYLQSGGPTYLACNCSLPCTQAACRKAYADVQPLAVPGGDAAAVFSAAKRAAASLARVQVCALHVPTVVLSRAPAVARHRLRGAGRRLATHAGTYGLHQSPTCHCRWCR